jgi:putative DNA primase/helicase
MPEPLTARIEPESYPVDALPGKIGAAVAEVQAFVQAPLPLVACSALSALSVAIQAHYDIKRADRLQGPASLFTLAIADSGERKTTVDGFFTTAIREWEAGEASAAEHDQRKFRADFAAWEKKREALLDLIKADAKKGVATGAKETELGELEAKKPEPPRVPRLLLGDETPENLAWTLAKHWPSGGVISSEAGVVLGAHGMKPDTIMRNLALLNVLWEGGELSKGRRTSESFTVRGARLTVGLQIQEAMLREFFALSRGLARGSGFLARFLIAWPASTQGHRPFREPPTNWPALSAFNKRLKELLDRPAPINEAGGLAPQVLELAPDAQLAWVAFHDEVEAELRAGGDLADVKDVASKAADNAARLAALFHAFEGDAGLVSLSAFEPASRVVAWHLSESRRFFGELALPSELADAARLDEWLLAYCRRERVASVPVSAIQKSGPGRLRQKAKLEPALGELAELGRAQSIRDGRAKTIAINPALLSEGGAP